MKYIDPDGRLILNYSAAQLKDMGLTQSQVTRFENVVNNIYNLVKDNPEAMQAIVNTTGFSSERIISDLRPGSGPTVDIANVGGGARGGQYGLVFDPTFIKSLASIDAADRTKLSEQTLGMGLTVLHEYGHYGDQITNDGNFTGQYTDFSRRIYDSETQGQGHLTYGKQRWKASLTGHRGTDIEVAGFGVEVTSNRDGSTSIQKGQYSKTTGGDLPPIPNSLPKEAAGENILKTLNVK